MAQKKLQKDSQYEHLDRDGDGTITDDEMAMEIKRGFRLVQHQPLD